MKMRYLLLLIVAIGTGYLNSYAQNYRIELSAFTHTINHSFFHYAGYEKTRPEQKDQGTKHYFSGHYDSYVQAEKAHKRAFNKGFKNARIVETKPAAFTATTVANNYHSYTNNRLFIRALSLKNGAGSLSLEERKHLQNIVDVLREHPYLKLRILHLEGEENILPAQKLKLLANFLLANGVAAYRIRMTNAHPDFVTAIQTLTTSPTKKGKQNKIALTLINQKEEIVLDTFKIQQPRHFTEMPFKELIN